MNTMNAGETSVQKNIVSNENCCVYGCTSVRKKNPELMYHAFPNPGHKVEVRDSFGQVQFHDRRKLWEIKLKMGKKVTKNMKVCSLHFTEDNYEKSGWASIKKLKLTAVPNQNLPSVSIQNRALSHESEREKRLKLRKEKQEQTVPAKPNQSSCEGSTIIDVERKVFFDQHEVSAADGLLLLGQPYKNVAVQCVSYEVFNKNSVGIQVDFDDLAGRRDAEVQVQTSDLLSVCDFIKTEKQLSTATGINSFMLLNTIVDLLSMVIKDQRIHKLSLYKRVFLTFLKMKMDLPYVFLSILFGVSAQTCKHIFFETIVSLTPILQSAIFVPSKEVIKNNMPKCFKNFQKVRMVLDCTEVPVQRHKRLCCRIKMYSHYKGTTTLKFLTAVTPGGVICYASPAYGGRSSDKIIFEKSRLLDELDMYHDEIMVDKGFLIDNICENFGIKVIRPPFLRKKTQFSQAEALYTYQVASARVHIERTNQRIKCFKMLTNRLPVNLLPVIDCIFQVICAVVNLSNPILADDKFLT